MASAMVPGAGGGARPVSGTGSTSRVKRCRFRGPYDCGPRTKIWEVLTFGPRFRASAGVFFAQAPKFLGRASFGGSTRVALTSNSDGEMLRLEPFPCGPIERKTSAKPLALVNSSPGQGSSDRVEDAPAAIAERFLPGHLTAVEWAKMGGTPKEQEEVKLSLMARVGKDSLKEHYH
jgi:hypothetical protein